MPAVESGKVLVTGANGYIAIWVVRTLLEQGYSVRGTVRSKTKGKHLLETFKSYGDKLEIVVVEDITKEGAFDEAVKGVDAVEHTASPFHFKAVEPEELITPAVHGTVSVLKSALTYGTTVKRVVVTSSCAAVLTAQDDPRVFSEKDWNELSIKEVEEKGRDALGAHKYRASKTLAERAAWDFVKTNKPSWDLVVLNPPYVFGPVLHEVKEHALLNSSLHEWFFTVFKGVKDNAALSSIGSSWIDVRDLALAHALALTKADAGGERIIISEGPYKWQDWVNAARKAYPDTPAGDVSYDAAKAVHAIRYDVTKADKILGLKYRSIEESAKDMVDDFKSRSWL